MSGSAQPPAGGARGEGVRGVGEGARGVGEGVRGVGACGLGDGEQGVGVGKRGEGARGAGSRLGRWRRDAERVDVALYAAIAQTPTPALDRAMARLSRAADYSRLSLGCAALLAASGPRGRRAALFGLASVATTATVVNLGAKPVGGRRRPDRAAEQVPVARHVRVPVSTSFPSGHTAGAFAFATGVGHVLPGIAIGLHGLAGLVGYSRVHTGVHYPGDVVAGALMGIALAQLTTRVLDARGTSSLSPCPRPA